MSFTLPQTLSAWQTKVFDDTFKQEMASLDTALLPLQQLLHHGSQVVGRPEFMILGSQANEKTLHIRTGVFFQSVLTGCSCADDPTPLDTYNEYGELELAIDRDSAATTITSI